MVCTCGTMGEHSGRIFKMAAFSPAQPRRAKTRRSAGKAARGAPFATFHVLRLTFHASARTLLADFFSILLEGFI